MNARLDWVIDDDGAVFTLTLGDELIPPRRWPVVVDQLSPSDRHAVPVLMGLLENESIEERTNGIIVAPHQILAQLDGLQITALGLPSPAPYTITIDGRGTLDRPEFEFHWSLIDSSGRKVFGPKIDGAFLTVGKRTYLLTEPLFSLIHGMQRYNASPPSDMDHRFLEWARLKELLPPDVIASLKLSHSMS